MRKSIRYATAMLLLLSCGKDSYQSKPRLTLKSVSTTTVAVNQSLQVTLRLTDKEGDFRDTVWVRKLTTRCPSSNFADSLKYSLPADLQPSSNFEGDIILTFSYPIELQPRCARPDTAVFSFWMKDAQGNRSDTAKTPSIIILR